MKPEQTDHEGQEDDQPHYPQASEIREVGKIAVQLFEFEHDPFIDGLKFEFPPEDYP